MLSLQLKSGEYLTIGDDIAVQIFELSGSTFQVAVKAPREIPILRGEVRERTGERPGGLREKRTKTPSQRVRDAERLQKWAEKREQAEAERKQAADEQAAVSRELRAILDQVDRLARDGAGPEELREQVEALRSRLDRVTGGAD